MLRSAVMRACVSLNLDTPVCLGRRGGGGRWLSAGRMQSATSSTVIEIKPSMYTKGLCYIRPC